MSEIVVKEGTGEIVEAEKPKQLASVAREQAHEQAVIQAASVLAMQNPRSETDSFAKIKRSCSRPGFAMASQYRFPRGGSQVTGPSVRLARELARCWGNLRSGFRVVERGVDNEGWETLTVQGFCHDLESNTLKVNEVTFRNAIQRKRGGQTVWIKPDPRDELELVNRNGAKVERNTILQVIPFDIIEDAIKACDLTSRKAAKGEIETDRTGTIRNLVAAFAGLGVTGDMIVSRIGHSVEQLTADEITDLRQIFQSLSDGNSQVTDHFQYAKVETVTSLDEAKARLGGSTEEEPKKKRGRPRKGQQASLTETD